MYKKSKGILDRHYRGETPHFSYSNRLCLSLKEANRLADFTTAFGFSDTVGSTLLCANPRVDFDCACPVTAAALLEANVREEDPCSFCHDCSRSCSIGFEGRAKR